MEDFTITQVEDWLSGNNWLSTTKLTEVLTDLLNGTRSLEFIYEDIQACLELEELGNQIDKVMAERREILNQFTLATDFLR
tara:strand:- start:654 stop:896 length:243 start_codon:yes stop_codon:yes gene_type:complete